MPSVESAIEKIERGEIEEGLQLLKALKESSDHDTLLEIAQIYHELGFIEDAVDLIEELMAFHPDIDELKLFGAELYMELEKEEESLDILSSIDDESDHYLKGLLLSADLYERQGLQEVAEQKLLTAKRKAPNEPVITFGLGEFYLHHGNMKRSAVYYEELLRTKHHTFNGTSVHLRLAEALTGSGEFEQALSHYENGLNDESNPDDWFGYALTARQIDEYQKTIQALNHLKDLDPQYTTLYPVLAQAYEAEGAHNEAMDTYLEGIRLDEFNEELYLHAGRLSLRQKEGAQGEDLLKQAISLNPSNMEATSTLMDHYLSIEQHESVIDLATEVERYGDLSPDGQWKTAIAHRNLENDEGALKYYESASHELADQADFLEDFGWYLIEIGQRDRAKSIMQKALKMDPDRYHLVEELERLEEF
jgi:tetratricopeptide (TPR) repeat protein